MANGPSDCNCYHCFDRPWAKKGRAPCEYHDHHCGECHDHKRCTRDDCRREFKASARALLRANGGRT